MSTAKPEATTYLCFFIRINLIQCWAHSCRDDLAITYQINTKDNMKVLKEPSN